MLTLILSIILISIVFGIYYLIDSEEKTRKILYLSSIYINFIFFFLLFANNYGNKFQSITLIMPIIFTIFVANILIFSAILKKID